MGACWTSIVTSCMNTRSARRCLLFIATSVQTSFHFLGCQTRSSNSDYYYLIHCQRIYHLEFGLGRLLPFVAGCMSNHPLGILALCPPQCKYASILCSFKIKHTVNLRHTVPVVIVTAPVSAFKTVVAPPFCVISIIVSKTQ